MLYIFVARRLGDCLFCDNPMATAATINAAAGGRGKIKKQRQTATSRAALEGISVSQTRNRIKGRRTRTYADAAAFLAGATEYVMVDLFELVAARALARKKKPRSDKGKAAKPAKIRIKTDDIHHVIATDPEFAGLFGSHDLMLPNSAHVFRHPQPIAPAKKSKSNKKKQKQ